MKDLDIALEYADTLYAMASDVVEETYNFSMEFMGYSPIAENVFFNTEVEAVEYLIKNDEVFEKCRDLSLKSVVVPVYDKDGGLLFYLPRDQVVEFKRGAGGVA